MDLSAENLAKLRLIRTPGLGAVSVKRLLLRYATAQAALENFTAWGKREMVLATLETVQREVAALQKIQGWLVCFGDVDYPAALNDLPDGPVVLSGLGTKEILTHKQVAVVGNRAASATGLSWSRETAHALAQAGVVLTSGLARGIDTVVHEGALQGARDSAPCTIAVVAGGIDHIYPPENAKLRARIIGQGCVVSEQPLGMQPIANLFPQRNRIIAGLSVGVVVSEATRHSGSLITAEYALNYGREVWAVPGSPAEARSGGPNWLLKNGATLIESAADILSQMPHSAAPYVQRFRAQPNLFPEERSRAADDLLQVEEGAEDTIQPARTRLFALLSTAPTTFDVLVRQTGLSEAEANALLIELELEGHACREADGRWRRG
jgi:DNA processing protein